MSNDDKSTSSASALCMADFWRQICRQKHEHCISANKNHNKPPILPKRVLDVANPSLSGPLLFCPPPGFRARYVTLSHCWGEKRLIRTLRSNISKWITGIPLAEIPKTFLDACDITSKLGYQYLWIDSLCIIQDSTEDWRDESTKMADIYSNADLCISALDSHDSSEGIYRSRDGLLHRPCRLWDEAPPGLCILQFSGLPIYAFADPSPPSSSTGPLAHRAWVLQEELMSGRRLIYGKNILYWSCLTMQVSTSEPDDFSAVGDTRFNNYLGWRQYFQEAIAKLRGTDVISRSDMENLYQCWLLVIENYSQRGLSRGSDKLTALAGVASEFGRITQDSFLSGLWSRFLWRQLLWSVASKGAPPFNREVPPKSIEPRLVPDFLGPTWSWSKIDGHIRYFHQYPLDKMGDHEVLVEILCSRCSPSSPKEISNNYSGVLSLRGFLAKAIAKPFSPGSKRIVMHDGLLESPQPTKEKIGQIKSRVDTLAKEIPIYPGDARPLGETASVDSSDLSQLPWSIDSSQYGSGFDNEIHSPGFSLIPKREFPVIQNLRDPIYPGHPVINFDGEQVGLWAPDLPSAQETVEIICLAISSNRQFVFCIGMELVNRYQNRYRRVGLIFWEKSAWATAAAETNKSLIELE
ncbi:HET-domain-containing protein, partial [Hyaloscypha bicolor E]